MPVILIQNLFGAGLSCRLQPNNNALHQKRGECQTEALGRTLLWTLKVNISRIREITFCYLYYSY